MPGGALGRGDGGFTGGDAVDILVVVAVRSISALPVICSVPSLYIESGNRCMAS